MGGRSAWHVHKQWTGATQIEVVKIQIEPVCRRPVIAGIAAKDRARLETITASPPLQFPSVVKVLLVVTNGLVPSLAMPPTPHMAPP